MKKRTPFLPFERRLKRATVHVPVGILGAFIFRLNNALGFGFLLSFLVYEVSEELHGHDEAHYDILGFMIGLVVGVALLYLMWISGVNPMYI